MQYSNRCRSYHRQRLAAGTAVIRAMPLGCTFCGLISLCRLAATPTKSQARNPPMFLFVSLSRGYPVLTHVNIPFLRTHGIIRHIYGYARGSCGVCQQRHCVLTLVYVPSQQRPFAVYAVAYDLSNKVILLLFPVVCTLSIFNRWIRCYPGSSSCVDPLLGHCG